MLTVGLLTIAGIVLDASMGVDVGVVSIAVCLLFAGALFAWGTCAIAWGWTDFWLCCAMYFLHIKSINSANTILRDLNDF
jgi:hypothetical protein